MSIFFANLSFADHQKRRIIYNITNFWATACYKRFLFGFSHFHISSIWHLTFKQTALTSKYQCMVSYLVTQFIAAKLINYTLSKTLQTQIKRQAYHGLNMTLMSRKLIIEVILISMRFSSMNYLFFQNLLVLQFIIYYVF